jgi:hypothetical protein
MLCTQIQYRRRYLLVSFYFAQQEKLLTVKDGCGSIRYKRGKNKIKKYVTKKAVSTCFSFLITRINNAVQKSDKTSQLRAA